MLSRFPFSENIRDGYASTTGMSRRRERLLIVGLLAAIFALNSEWSWRGRTSTRTQLQTGSWEEKKRKSDEFFVLKMLNKNVTWEEVPQLFPSPIRVDTIEIYNARACEDLLQLVRTRESWSIVPNGGSATAGGVHDWPPEGKFNFGNRFVDYLNLTGQLAPGANVTVVPRGHGTRHSLHSALLMDFYVPPATDVVLWEFAINDYGYHLDASKGILEERNSIIYWMDAMAQRQPKPPLVILAYLWKGPYQRMSNGKIDNPVFDAHARLAANYSFVVGHVNLASYIDELREDHGLLVGMPLNKSLLGDDYHPNPLGHAVLAYLMLDMVTNTSRVPRVPMTVKPEVETEPQNFQWPCGNDTEERVILMNRIVKLPGRSPKPIATFTQEIPKNDILFPGMLSVAPDYECSIVTLGKADPRRVDRQMGYSVPCCRSSAAPGTSSNSTSCFHSTLDFVHPSGPLQGIQALMVGAQPAGKLQVHFDEDFRHPARGSWMDVSNWPCLWNFKDLYPDLHWFVLDQPRIATTQIHFCSVDDVCCGDGSTSSPTLSPVGAAESTSSTSCSTQILSLIVM
jgi:hypothetical protein